MYVNFIYKNKNLDIMHVVLGIYPKQPKKKNLGMVCMQIWYFMSSCGHIKLGIKYKIYKIFILQFVDALCTFTFVYLCIFSIPHVWVWA